MRSRNTTPRPSRCPRSSHARLVRPRLRHARGARRRRARSGDRRARGADPPDHLVRVREQRACGVAVQHGALGHVYSRISNPTNAVLEERIAALEGGVGAIATASGQAALHLAICTLAGAGSHIVSSSALYGGSHNLLHYTLSRFGIATTFVKPGDIDGWRAAIRPETRLLFGETLGNPGLDVLDIPTVAALAHDNGLPLLVDSTFTTPWLMKPFDHGADLVFHSATKFLSGHGTVVGGLLVDSGQFDWSAHARPGASPSWRGRTRLPRHGVRRGKQRRRVPAARAPRGPARLRRLHEPAHRVAGAAGHRDLAAADGPPRRERHAVVDFLAAQPMVESVAHPRLESHPDHRLAERLLPRGAGAVFSFNLRGSREQGRAFIEALKIFSHLANVGDCRSLVIHPASTTHFRMDDAALAQAGITAGTIRLSIGLEDVADLIDDLKRALGAAKRAA
jgi:O-acetylhomoserine (thiol)-lyase